MVMMVVKEHEEVVDLHVMHLVIDYCLVIQVHCSKQHPTIFDTFDSIVSSKRLELILLKMQLQQQQSYLFLEVEGKMKSEKQFFLSPAGEQFACRRLALKSMVEGGAGLVEVNT